MDLSTHREDAEKLGKSSSASSSRSSAAATQVHKPVGDNDNILLPTRPIQKSSLSIYVYGLPLTLDSAGLCELFSQYGQVRKTTRVIRNKGYGFVDFDNPESAEAALLATSSSNPLRLNGHPIQVARLKSSKLSKTNNNSWTTSSTSDSGGFPIMPPTSSSSLLSKRRPEEDDDSPTKTLSKDAKIYSKPETRVDNLKKIDENPLQSDAVITIANIPDGTTLEDLRKVFDVYGRVKRLVIQIKGLSSGKPMAESRSGKTVVAQYVDPDALKRVKTACGEEGFEVMVMDAHTVHIGPYDVTPSLLDLLDFLTPFGDLFACEIKNIETEATIEFEKPESVVAALHDPVFCRGNRLTLSRKVQESPEGTV